MKEKGEIWCWYHHVCECYYHIQITVKYRKSLLDKRVEQTILESMKGFKERYAIEIQQVGFDQNHVHLNFDQDALRSWRRVLHYNDGS